MVLVSKIVGEYKITVIGELDRDALAERLYF